MNNKKTIILINREDYTAYLPAIDVEEGLRRLMNNKKIYFKLLKRFDVRQMVNKLIMSIKNTDFPVIKNNAHTLKGAAANLALTELKNLAFDIEERAKIGAECFDMIVKLDEAANRAIQLIETLLKKEGFNE